MIRFNYPIMENKLVRGAIIICLCSLDKVSSLKLNFMLKIVLFFIFIFLYFLIKKIVLETSFRSLI